MAVKEDLRNLYLQSDIIINDWPDRSVWPAWHQETFDQIDKIGEQKYDDYATDGVDYTGKPYRRQTKNRAQFLVERARALLSQRRNEMGWRYHIEKAVLARFQSEVACFTCKARIWRSDVEAYIHPSEDTVTKLRERRKDRTICKCPANLGRDPYYAVGTDPVFEDRVEEMIILEQRVKKLLPKLRKMPDLVFGLRQPAALKGVLDALRINEASDLRCNPFSISEDPIIFPFFILEAKAEQSSYGFHEAHIQTAFPILTLLQLQESVRVKASGSLSDQHPLVWYFAYRGDYWRVYGSYITDNAHKKYNVIRLWDGAITDKNKALQLILIVDYIVDWARDVYRATIFRQLESAATGAPYDRITLPKAIFLSPVSTIQLIGPKMPLILPTADIFQIPISEPLQGEPVDHEGVLTMPIPQTKPGTFCSASVYNATISGLRVTEDNVKIMLRLAEGEGGKAKKAARELLNFLGHWDEILSISEADLDQLESTWTSNHEIQREKPTGSSIRTFHTLMEVATFMSAENWTITKEIIYLAISEQALTILNNYAAYQRRPSGIASIPQKTRVCSSELWRDTIKCLCLSSPWQNFTVAISCLLVGLYALPERERPNQSASAESIAIRAISESQLLPIIRKFGENKFPSDECNEPPAILGPDDLTLMRSLCRRNCTSPNKVHSLDGCKRCRDIGTRFPKHKGFPEVEVEPGQEDVDVIFHLVHCASDQFGTFGPDLCIYEIELKLAPENIEPTALDELLDKFLQDNEIGNTIRHPISPRPDNEENDIFNLTQPVRPMTKEQREVVHKWARNLRAVLPRSDVTLVFQNTPETVEEVQHRLRAHSV